VPQQGGTATPTKPQQVKAVAPRSAKNQAQPAATNEKSSSLFSRIGHGLKKLVTRAPRKQH